MKKIYILLFALLAATSLATAQNLFNASTATLETWFTSSADWSGETQSTGAYNNGVVTVNIAVAKNEQWKAQVKLHTDLQSLDPSKTYTFSCTMQCNHALSGVTVKVFDEVELSYANQSVTLAAGTAYNYSSNPFSGATNLWTKNTTTDAVIVWDFGQAQAGDVITISNIVLQQVASTTPSVTPGATTASTEVGSGTENGTYTLVWADYFDQGSLNTNAWNIEVNGDGGGNNELQYYCAKGVSVGAEPATGNQCLILTATKESYGGRTCTSGRVNTKNKVHFTHGKVEASIKFPNTANGLWPAFWMMGNDYDQVGWPKCGETDIIEMGHSNGYTGNVQDRYFNGASHWGQSWQNHPNYAQSVTYGYGLTDDFHLITCIWDDQKVAMYVDLDKYPNAQPYYQMSINGDRTDTDNTAYYFHKHNFILFNLAVGGLFPGITDINNITALANGPRSMYVDYVLVYQQTRDITIASGATNTATPDGTASLIDEQIQAPKAQKIFRNGQIYILRDGAVYTLTGVRVE